MNIKRLKELIFGKIVKVQDDFFGEMIDGDTYYECRRYFNPIGQKVEIGLEKENITSSEKQRQFFQWIEDNYDLITTQISPFLEKEVKSWIEHYQIKDFQKEFKLDYLYIPKCNTDTFDWRIAFYAENELQHSCEVEMNGLDVKSIHIDG